MLGCALSAAAQQPPAAPEAKPWVYEVVSVKPDKPGKTGTGYSSWWRSTPDGFSANIQPLSLLMSAYGVFMESQLVGLPDWARTEQFDVEARIDPDRLAEYQKLPRKERSAADNAMLQALLAERFGLKVHRETKELPVYELVIAKDGAKLKETAEGKPGGYSMYPGKLEGNGIELGSLVISLQNSAGRIIVDKTGLKGRYDISLKWSANDDPNSGDSGPDLFTALQEQLGLKLQPAKAPVDTIVIEHIERPSEN